MQNSNRQNAANKMSLLSLPPWLPVADERMEPSRLLLRLRPPMVLLRMVGLMPAAVVAPPSGQSRKHLRRSDCISTQTTVLALGLVVCGSTLLWFLFLPSSSLPPPPRWPLSSSLLPVRSWMVSFFRGSPLVCRIFKVLKLKKKNS